MRKSREQKLIDICFEIALTLHMYHEQWRGASKEQVAEWISKQLRECGFPTTRVGMSWGVLEDEPKSERLKKIKAAVEDMALAIYEASVGPPH